MLRNKWLMGLAGGGILLVGLVLGALINGGLPAWAFGARADNATPNAATQGAYCQLYLQTLASNLPGHPSVSEVEKANQAAMTAVIQQAAKDGKITQQQESRALQKVSEYGSQPCAALGQMGRGFGHAGGRGFGSSPLAGAHQAVLTAVAAKLGMTATDLQSSLDSGKSVAEIAQSKGVALTGTDGLNAVYLSAVQSQLDSAVKNGTITQTQSQMMLTMVQHAVDAQHYPLLDGHDVRW